MMGITKFGHVNKIAAAVAAVKTGSAPRGPATSSETPPAKGGAGAVGGKGPRAGAKLKAAAARPDRPASPTGTASGGKLSEPPNEFFW